MDRVGTLKEALKNTVREIPDFPSVGVLFRDLGPVWADEALNRAVVEMIVESVSLTYGVPDAVIGVESRGFIYGMPLAMAWGVPFITVRKSGKLPGQVLKEMYALEYGEAALEVQCDALSPGSRVLVHDDVLATGGTANAVCQLVERCGAEVLACSFVIELLALGGRHRLSFPTHSLLDYT